MYGGHIIIHKPVCLHITTDTKIATVLKWLSDSKVRLVMLGGVSITESITQLLGELEKTIILVTTLNIVNYGLLNSLFFVVSVKVRNSVLSGDRISRLCHISRFSLEKTFITIKQTGMWGVHIILF